MSFAEPLVLWALLAIPLAVAVYFLAQRRRPKYAVKFTNLDLLANVVDKTPDFKRHLPPILYVAAIAALIFAIARPESTEQVPKEEATVILLMDVSGSMRATDVQPSRLDAAKASAGVLLDKLPAKFQVALISFSNNVKTIVPPTKDRDEVRRGLLTLFPDKGTAMGDGIQQAVDLARPPANPDALPSTVTPVGGKAAPTPTTAAGKGPNDRPAVIVLLSDGANSTGSVQPIPAANDAKDRGVRQGELRGRRVADERRPPDAIGDGGQQVGSDAAIEQLAEIHGLDAWQPLGIGIDEVRGAVPVEVRPADGGRQAHPWCQACHPLARAEGEVAEIDPIPKAAIGSAFQYQVGQAIAGDVD